jgi:hypothetical protein
VPSINIFYKFFQRRKTLKRSLLFVISVLATISLACNLGVGKPTNSTTPTVPQDSFTATLSPVTDTPQGSEATDTSIPSDTSQALKSTNTTSPAKNTPTLQQTTDAKVNSILINETGTMNFGDNVNYNIDISQNLAWKIDILKPGWNVAILPPGQLKGTVPSTTVDLTVTTSGSEQIAGVRCMFGETGDYYQVALKDKSFAIGEMINGKFVQLTSPYWKTSQFFDDQGLTGSAAIEVVCTPYGVGLSINGNAEIPLTAGDHDNYPGGPIALFAESPTDSTTGSYTSVIFAKLNISAG